MKLRTASLAFAVVCALIANFGCTDGSVPVTPAPSPVVSSPDSTPTPRPVTVIETLPPFCPFVTHEQFRVTESRPGLFQFSWQIVTDAEGRYLRRYQIEVARKGRLYTTLEADVKTLSGPHNRTAIHEWKFPGSDVGAISARIRVWYPNECHDHGGPGLRLNGQWGDWVASAN